MSPASSSMRSGSMAAAASRAGSIMRSSTSATRRSLRSASSRRRARRRPMKPGKPVRRSVATARDPIGRATLRSSAAAGHRHPRVTRGSARRGALGGRGHHAAGVRLVHEGRCRARVEGHGHGRADRAAAAAGLRPRRGAPVLPDRQVRLPRPQWRRPPRAGGAAGLLHRELARPLGHHRRARRRPDPPGRVRVREVRLPEHLGGRRIREGGAQDAEGQRAQLLPAGPDPRPVHQVERAGIRAPQTQAAPAQAARGPARRLRRRAGPERGGRLPGAGDDRARGHPRVLLPQAQRRQLRGRGPRAPERARPRAGHRQLADRVRPQAAGGEGQRRGARAGGPGDALPGLVQAQGGRGLHAARAQRGGGEGLPDQGRGAGHAARQRRRDRRQRRAARAGRRERRGEPGGRHRRWAAPGRAQRQGAQRAGRPRAAVRRVGGLHAHARGRPLGRRAPWACPVRASPLSRAAQHS